MPVMILFRHGETLTLAIIDRELNKRDAEKDVLRKVTLIKDVGCSEPLRAHLDILNDLTLDRLHDEYGFRNFVELHRAWAKKLDSSELNKKFYREVTDWYFWALHHSGVVLPRDLDGKSEKEKPIFFIRLLTRMIFCWFLQEKGLIPRQVFRWNWAEGALKDSKLDSGTYYQAVLQNLFFATLNREPEKREFRDKKTTGRYDGNRGVHTLYRYEDLLADPKGLLELLSAVPFINGGLFDCLDQVYKKAEQRPTRRLDGFSDNAKESVTIPNQLFFGDATFDLSADYNDQRKTVVPVHGLIEILSRYKFTVEENTPLEEEIALDPELLGKVFENLLASYNEDTKTTARKKIGAFYTPRDVVQYMVDESLVAYFPAALEQKVRLLLSEQALNPLDEAETALVIEAIERVRVLDPACGSGAFPMGVLHRLVHLLAKLDPKNRRWKEQQLRRAQRDLKRAELMEDPENRAAVRRDVEARLADIERSFQLEHHDLDFARKLYLIENSIFGADIEPIAGQISKLRFFIALLVDQKVNANAYNFGVRPLPNLETRIVAANTLMPVEKVNDHQMYIGADQVRDLRDRLALVRHRHFNARTPEEKQRYREEDAAIREELAVELHRQGMPNETARLLAGWDPYNQNAHADFFDPEWMFSLDAGDFSGFDIVIGNPPYVRQEKIKELKPQLRKNYECFTGVADLYVYFYERGVQLLRPGGIFSFITSNKWFRSGYGEKLRAWLKKNTRVLRLIDFGDAEIFDAIAYPCIVILSKGAPVGESGFRALKWDMEWQVADVRAHLAGDTFAMPQRDLAIEAWRLESGAKLKLIDRIKAAGVPLGDYVGGRFYRGILTGLNEAFVVNREKRDELIAKHPSSAEVLKPFLRGRDIKRWRVEFEDLYLLFVPWHFPLHDDPAISGSSEKAEVVVSRTLCKR
jgi:type I restriction-modification system DNA methylase subunit